MPALGPPVVRIVGAGAASGAAPGAAPGAASFVSGKCGVFVNIANFSNMGAKNKGSRVCRRKVWSFCEHCVFLEHRCNKYGFQCLSAARVEVLASILSLGRSINI